MPGVGARANPFLQADQFYSNPALAVNWRELATHAASSDASLAQRLERLTAVPSAFWIDSKSKIHDTGGSHDTLEGILASAAEMAASNGGRAPLCTFVWYDLPNRDCHAKASSGEICCGGKLPDGRCDLSDQASDCAAGLHEYETEYVDPFIAVLSRYEDRVPIVIIVEPDSLPNLITNDADPHCGAATFAGYTKGVGYAVRRLSEAVPSVSVYLDAGHGGWLGWDDDARDYMKMVCDLGIMTVLRGFSTNVANYDPTGTVGCPVAAFTPGENVGHFCNWVVKDHPCCRADPCALVPQYNSGPTEVVFAQTLRKHAGEQCAGATPHMIIDTARNGNVGARASDCRAWCNLRGASVGEPPTTRTALPDLIDAYLWVKTPGESDGCTATLPGGGQCARFDSDCALLSSIGAREGEPRAPEAGVFFSHQALQLAANAPPTFDEMLSSPTAMKGVLPSLAPATSASLRSSPPPAWAGSGANVPWQDGSFVFPHASPPLPPRDLSSAGGSLDPSVALAIVALVLTAAAYLRRRTDASAVREGAFSSLFARPPVDARASEGTALTQVQVDQPPKKGKRAARKGREKSKRARAIEEARDSDDSSHSPAMP